MSEQPPPTPRKRKTDAAKATKPQKAPKRAAPDPHVALELRWDLGLLPSSQHRAGLAGLALCVAFFQRKHPARGVCRVKAIDQTSLILEVDRIGMQGLFDDIYNAATEEVFSKQKWAGAEPKRTVEVEVKEEKGGKAKSKTEKRFVYDKVVPAGELIAEWDAGDSKLWLKLWQDLVWTTLRGVPATREPYNARAESRAIEDGAKVWDELASKPNASVDLSSTYALGVQDKTAENVPIEDIALHQFLLHFWPFAISIYVPVTLQRDGSRDHAGYAVAMPDVAVLDEFVSSWERVVRGRSGDASGFRPREAVIDLAAEAGLDVVRRTNEVLAGKQVDHATRKLLAAVDVFHLQKEGNNIRMRGIGRIVPQRKQDDEYARVRSAGYWSPVFRRQRISNVLEGKPWWFGFARMCSISPDEMTIRHNQFQHDCKTALAEVEMKQDAEESEQTLEHLIYARVRSYVLGKTERKYSLSWSSVKGNPAKESEYNEKKEKVAREAFLAVRSRTGADFVGYFTATICSVSHHSSEEKYLEVARALLDPTQVESVRSLTLLALSAVA